MIGGVDNMQRYAIIDIEATGGSAQKDRITEVAIFIHDGKRVLDRFSSLVNPQRHIPPFISKLTGITNEMVANAPMFADVAQRIFDITEGAIFVAHNVKFDYSYIKAEFKRLGMRYQRERLCTVDLTRKVFPHLPSYGLGNVTKHLNIPIEDRHRAAGDAAATVQLFERLLSSGAERYISRQLNHEHIKGMLPENLSFEDLILVPEETGVVYLHDAKGKVLFMSRANDMRQRLRQVLGRHSQRSRTMVRQVYDISHQETGSTLIAELMELYALKKLRPKYNRSAYKNARNYGLYKETQANGAIKLVVDQVKSRRDTPALMRFQKPQDARLALLSRAKKNKLCLKQIGLESGPGPCSHQKLGLCMGCCVGSESTKTHNRRLRRALGDQHLPHSNFFIIGAGRDNGERSVVWVENECFKGFGFFDASYVNDMEEVKCSIKTLEHTPEAARIIRDYLKKNRMDKVVAYSA